MAKKHEPTGRHEGEKRYVRRDDSGRFKVSDDVGRSVAGDRGTSAKAIAKTVKKYPNALKRLADR